MSVISFENLKVTTMTLVIPLVGTVNLDAAFDLLKITRIHLPQPKRQSQKFKIPHCTAPGAILSLRYKGVTRGIIRSTSSKHFKNSITIDIATQRKNVSIKLSSTKIQMCGASSVDQGMEGSNYIISQLLEIQDHLDYIHENPDRLKSTLDWLKEATRGNPTQRIIGAGGPEGTVETRARIESDFFIRHPLGIVSPHSPAAPIIPGPVIYPEPTEKYPDFVDARIADFLLRPIFEYVYVSDFHTTLDWLSSIKTVTSRPLHVQQVHKAMVNYNYDLGFSVKRYELVRRINGLNGFYARYHNSIEHNVTIELPYIVPEQHKAMRKKNKNPCHIFLVYMSGLVTQSGPGEELMREAYYRFNETINSIREFIFKEEASRTLKFKPRFTPKEVPVITKEKKEEPVEVTIITPQQTADPMHLSDNLVLAT